jgi:CheY-like chemotaxis protein
VDLVLTDLHLAGDSGLRLLELLAADPACGARPGWRCSAAKGAHIPPAWVALGVWRVVPKPASVKALTDCVEAALAEEAGR